MEKDLKTLPIGTIGYNNKNRFVTLHSTKDKLICYSNSEDITMSIKTKVLNVEVEVTPEILFDAIVDLPQDIYTVEQLNFIKKACMKWSNNRVRNIAPREIKGNTVYTFISR